MADTHNPECYPAKDSHAMDCPYRMSGGSGECDCRMSDEKYRKTVT